MKFALLEPAAIKIEAGTVRPLVFELRAAVMPSAGAGPFRLTLQLIVPLGTTEVEVHVMLFSV